MNTATKILCGIAVCGIAIVPAMAGEHGRGHHGGRGGNDGVLLAAEIVGVVRDALTPGAAVFRPAAPPPPPPHHHHVTHREVPRHPMHHPAPPRRPGRR